MAGRERIAALQRARLQQRELKAQTARTARAYAAAERARSARQRIIRRVEETTDAACIETARLVAVCGSEEEAAEILGMDPDDVRRAMSSIEGIRRQPERRRRAERRTESSIDAAEPGGRAAHQ